MKKTILMMMTAVLVVGAAAQAATYQEVLTAGQLQGGTSSNLQAAVIEGTTVYAMWTQGDGGAHIEAVDAVTAAGGTVITNPSWQLAGGASDFSPFYGPSIVGNDIMFTDSSTDAVWKVNKNTGEASQYVSASDIMAYTGKTQSQLLSPQTAGPGGEYYFYEGQTDSVLRTNGAGSVITFVTDTQLAAIAGTDSISGGLTFDDHGNMIWGNSSSNGVYSWDGSTGTTLLTTAQITAITGEAGAGSFGDFYYAPDGLVYFYESTSDSIMSFDSDDAAGTLAFVLTEAELLAGPAASDSVGSLTWYDGNIAWTAVTPSVNGLYAVPEPMTLALLGFGSMGVLRRRRVR